MPGLVNYRGNENFYPGRLLCAGDSGPVFSIGAHMETYATQRKRSRVIKRNMFEERRPSIDMLPDECLYEIFTRLPGGQARSVSACVSKRWLSVLSSIRSSEFRSSHDSDLKNQDYECDEFHTRCVEGKKATDLKLAAISVQGGLEKLSIRGTDSLQGITSIGLSAVARGSPLLKDLSLWNLPYIDDEGLLEIARECHLLEKLDLCQCSLISNKGVAKIVESSPNLTSLTIESCTNIGNESLQAIAKYCPKLQSISIKECPFVGDKGIASLFSASKMLTNVKLQSLNIGDCSVAVIGHYGREITNLSLTALRNVSQKGFWVMGSAKGLQKLSSLTINSCSAITDLSLQAVGSGSPNLKHLSLRKCYFLSDNGLIAFAESAQSLESMHLEECNRITQFGILKSLSSKIKSISIMKCMGIKDLSTECAILSPSESLCSLSIQSCPGFGSTSLEMIGKLCPNLQLLDFSGLREITDASLLPLLESFKKGLVKVNLSKCVNLTDEVISALCKFHGRTLELVNVSGCGMITDMSLAALAHNCHLLNDLDVSKCSVTDSGVITLSCGEQKNLQILSISGCPMVSNGSLQAFEKLGKNLLGLNVRHCKSISSSAIDFLNLKLWRCDILS